MRMRTRILSLTGLAALLVTSPAARAADSKAVARTADGHPDLSGTYDVATLTPLARPAMYGDKAFITRDEAVKIEEQEKALMAAANRQSDPDREAPPDGGDGSDGASGNVGGYNAFWIDRGTAAFEIDGKFATSIIVDPANGQFPPMTPAAMERAAAQRAQFRENKGDAWWLTEKGPGPYDNMETRGLGERCLLGFGSAGGPPMLPVLYNNMKKIVQTPDHVMILVEMVHDARDRAHESGAPARAHPQVDGRLGRALGRRHAGGRHHQLQRPAGAAPGRPQPARGRAVHATRLRAAALPVRRWTDPTVWTASWSGEYVWPASPERVFEYACHEGNYALGNIMRGARLLEADALTKTIG